jgi:probable rRNA maturation factor
MINLQIDKQYRVNEISAALQTAVEAALTDQGKSRESEISVMITGDAKLRKLNQQFLSKDHATDVLSFPSGGDGNYLGDIAISYPRAKAQAAVGGHRVQEELQLLTVHGVLHLLGHDHAEPEEKTRMWTAQERILRQLGVSPHVARQEA